jgi:hypothetical protein
MHAAQGLIGSAAYANVVRFDRFPEGAQLRRLETLI